MENLLSPDSLEKNCQVSYDLNLKLCDGLGSSAIVHSGEYSMDKWVFRIFVDGEDMTEQMRKMSPEVAELDGQLEMLAQEFELRVAEGIAERDTDGRIKAHVEFSGVTKNNAETMRLLGIKSMTFATSEEFLSLSSENPTVFESTADFLLEKGAMVPPLFGTAIPTELDVIGDVFVTARLYKDEQAMLGEYAVASDYWVDLNGIGKMKLEFDLVGRVSLRLID